MKIDDFNYLQTLLNGYRTEGKKGTLTCIYCDKEVDADGIAAHLLQHSDLEKFNMFLHADSVFAFTAKEKIYISHVLAGCDDRKIAEKMGIPFSSSRRMRNEFKSRIQQARGLIAMAQLLGDKLERQKRSEPVQPHTEMPVLDASGRIVEGFCKTKQELHAGGFLHSTSLIVVVKKDPQTGEPAILIVDKANKTAAPGGAEYLHHYDVLGGHVRICDWELGLDKAFDCNQLIGTAFPKEKVMWNCARRELARELVSPRQSDDSLSFWFEDIYSGENDEGSVNREITECFLCRYRNDASVELNSPGEVRVKDDWVDSIGKTTSHTYVGRFWRIPELLDELKKPTVKAFDGLERVLNKLEYDPAAKKHLTEWFGG